MENRLYDLAVVCDDCGFSDDGFITSHRFEVGQKVAYTVDDVYCPRCEGEAKYVIDYLQRQYIDDPEKIREMYDWVDFYSEDIAVAEIGQITLSSNKK